MGLSNIATIDIKQINGFQDRYYFDPGRNGYAFDVKCRIKFKSTTKEIIDSRHPHPKYDNRFEYFSLVEILDDNRKNERNQIGKCLTWSIPQDIVNLIVRQVGDIELLNVEFIVRVEKSKGARRYYRSEVVKSTIPQNDFGDTINGKEPLDEKQHINSQEARPHSVMHQQEVSRGVPTIEGDITTTPKSDWGELEALNSPLLNALKMDSEKNPKITPDEANRLHEKVKSLVSNGDIDGLDILFQKTISPNNENTFDYFVKLINDCTSKRKIEREAKLKLQEEKERNGINVNEGHSG